MTGHEMDWKSDSHSFTVRSRVSEKGKKRILVSGHCCFIVCFLSTELLNRKDATDRSQVLEMKSNRSRGLGPGFRSLRLTGVCHPPIHWE